MKKVIKTGILILLIVITLGTVISLYNKKNTSIHDESTNFSTNNEKEVMEEKLNDSTSSKSTSIQEKEETKEIKEDKKSETQTNESIKEEQTSTTTTTSQENNAEEKNNNEVENDNDGVTNTTSNDNNTETNNNTSNESNNSDNKKLIEHQATFYINNNLYAVKCSSEKNSCTIKTPDIKVSGYESIGWSTSQNSKEIKYKENEEISLDSDKVFYAVMRKKINIDFISNDSKINEKKTESKSCYIYNFESSCKVTSPSAKTSSDIIAIGWNSNENSREKEWAENEEKSVSKNKKYYLITRSKEKITATFKVRDNNAATASYTETSCYLYNSETKCKVTTPKLTAKQNGTAIGWSITTDGSTAPIKSEQQIEIGKNTTYYSITSLKVIITFDKNTSYNNNTVKKGESGYDYSKENIAAEKLSFYETSCYSYNGKGCKITKIPIIYSTGNEIRGFAQNPTSRTVNIYNVVFLSDKKLYARVYNNENRGTFNTISYGSLGNVPIEMDRNLSVESRNAYMNYIKQLYNDMPELFYVNGKLTLLSEPVYASSVKGSSAGITGGSVPNVLINIPTNVVLDKNREATIVHELGHAFGDQYGRRTGNYPEKNPELINIYNAYSKYSTKPMREYSYAHINEFYADMFRFSYEERFHRGTDIGTATTGYTAKTTPEINNILNRYLCVARNGYNENASSCK